MLETVVESLWYKICYDTYSVRACLPKGTMKGEGEGLYAGLSKLMG